MINTPTTVAPAPPAPRRAGRPRRLKREDIIGAALSLLAENPSAPLSLTATARALAVTPMALYTCFAGRDELQQAVTEALLADFAPHIPPGTPPCETLSIWAHAMRRHCLAHPALINLLLWEGGHVATGWLERAVIVVRAVAALGLPAAETGRASLWIWHVVMGAIKAEINPLPMVMGDEDFARLTPAAQRDVALVRATAQQPGFNETFFAYQLARLFDGLRALAQT